MLSIPMRQRGDRIGRMSALGQKQTFCAAAKLRPIRSPQRAGRASGPDPLDSPQPRPGPLIALKLRSSEFEWEIWHVAREASFEAKESDESRSGIGSRWRVVAGGQRVRSGRWSAERYSDGEQGSYSL
jgi:hypothetical protein